ncbi:MAG: hypothetical protein EPN37_14685 [Chitinophagaceae bacterium]|nr:MAG: hypothetical protein EPN37_14685 [Chitinophagaceae bacterium]
MISIIICSKDPRQLSLVVGNIRETIGIPYEIIAIENSSGKYGIGEAYNNGAKKAKYKYLCFIHEDIEFSNVGWGRNIISHFKDEELGLIGVAGSSYKSKIPSGWGGIQQFDYCNVYQEDKASDFSHLYSNPRNEEISRVVVLDGVFLAVQKKVWEEVNFDQDIFTGFHCYDLDFSLRVLDHYEVAVVYDIVIRHFSVGRFDNEWLRWSLILQKKFKHKLPVFIQDYGKINITKSDFQIFKFWGQRIFMAGNIGVFYEMRWLLGSLFVLMENVWLSYKRRRSKSLIS